MTDPSTLLTLALAAFAAVAIVSFAALSGWRGWLDLQRAVLQAGRVEAPAESSAGLRIELADLRERIRKLEAIAAGVDL